MLSAPKSSPKAPAGGVTGEDIIRGSSDIPLSPAGRQQTVLLANQLRAKGGLHGVVTSDLKRAHNTAQIIAARDPNAKIIDVSPALQPWHLGQFEGQPTSSTLSAIQDHIKNPDKPVPGRGSQSTADGESFNSFKNRFLGYTSEVMQAWQQNPHLKILEVTHYRGIKAIQSWIKAGAKPDLSIDPEEMTKHDGKPGDLFHLAPSGQGWTLNPINVPKTGKLQPGVYILRHGATPWNGSVKGFK